MTPPDRAGLADRLEYASRNYCSPRERNALLREAASVLRGMPLEEAVAAFLNECGSVFGDHIDLATRRRLVADGLRAALFAQPRPADRRES